MVGWGDKAHLHTYGETVSPSNLVNAVAIAAGDGLSLVMQSNGIVVGLNILIALRVLGLFRTIPYTSLNKLFPIIWTGVVLQFLSGGTLWMSKPGRYIGDGVFLVKFSLVIIGVI